MTTRGGGTFDYIIVGAGSAGCVLAERLSAGRESRVLVLEAGLKDSSLHIHMPGGIIKLMTGTKYNWAFRTVPQRHLGGRQLVLPQGKGIGGSSSINGMLYSRGNPRDYDTWRQMGNSGWAWEDVLPYFVATENNTRLAGPLHGQSGALHVTDPASPHFLSRCFVEAAVECGVPRNADFNGTEQEGAGLFQQTLRKSWRWSAARAFLDPARKRVNVTVLSSVTASRIIVERGRARGVEVIDHARNKITYRAEREVVVASGAIGSPKLLLLSGIGPPDDLKSAGVDVVHDLPGVGKNLHDHPDITILYEVKGARTYDGQDAFLPAMKNGLEFLLFGTGPVSGSPCQASAYVRSDPAIESVDISEHFLPVGVVNQGGTRLSGNHMTLNANSMRPRSRGEIRLASSDPLEPPLVDPNYLADQYDVRVLIECVRWGRRIMSAPSLAKYAGAERFPGKDIVSDADLEAYIRRNVQTDYHLVGACKMGSDSFAVVDDQLKVRGVEGLRVADSSIMPSIISGNTNAPTIVIGAKAADLILRGRHAAPAGASLAAAS
jgi:choline dehydrogenase-like flavoprotein